MGLIDDTVSLTHSGSRSNLPPVQSPSRTHQGLRGPQPLQQPLQPLLRKPTATGPLKTINRASNLRRGLESQRA